MKIDMNQLAKLAVEVILQTIWTVACLVAGYIIAAPRNRIADDLPALFVMAMVFMFFQVVAMLLDALTTPKKAEAQ